ncbi:MAG: hypothetical protein H7328_13020 [Bdellovibrio sp.]|nr:hypothetical protein [Bdellovibrio sp.]
MKKLILKNLFVFALILASSACAKIEDATKEDALINVVKSALFEANRTAAADENGAVGANAMMSMAVTIDSSVRSLAACSHTGFTCVGTLRDVLWNGCTTATAALTGGWKEEYNTNACCTSFGNSCFVKRVSATSGSTTTFAGGNYLITSSENHTTYSPSNVTITGSNGVTTVKGAIGDRSVTINGLHRIAKTKEGEVIFDHSLRSTVALTLAGSRASGTRVVTSGAIEVFHNTAAYTALSTFSNLDPVKWETPSCCYPTNGTISTIYTGTQSGATTIKFSPVTVATPCGSAVFTDLDNRSSPISLTQCE